MREELKNMSLVQEFLKARGKVQNLRLQIELPKMKTGELINISVRKTFWGQRS